MKAYKKRVLVYNMDGDVIDRSVSNPILLEEKPEDEEYYLDWQNIESQILRRGLDMGISSNGKLYVNGRCISKRAKDYDTFKLKLVVEYFEVKISMKDLMDYDDADAAIKYIVERGLMIAMKNE